MENTSRSKEPFCTEAKERSPRPVGVSRMVRPLTLREFFDQEYLVERPLCPSSEHQVRVTIRALDRWWGAPVNLAELSRDLLNRFLADHGKNHAPKTVARRRGDLLSLWKLAADLELAPDPPRRVRVVRVPRRLPEAWSRRDLAKMLWATERAESYYPTGIRIGAFWELFLRVGYDTALRLADILDLEISAVTRPSFQVLQRKTQTATLCRLRESTLEAIDRTIPPRRRLVFPWPYSRVVFYAHWKRYVLAPAGLPVGAREGPQKLRRSAASHLEGICPGAAMGLLGHHTPGLAYRSYVDPRQAQARRPLPPEIGETE